MDLLIIGYDQPGQMGAYLGSAASRLGLSFEIMSIGAAETTNRFVQKFYWHFRGKRPARSAIFASRVLERCAASRPATVLTTGCRVPLERRHIELLRRMGAKVINFSTDDPWNSALHAPWFVTALPAYDAVFTPRRANFADFRRVGVPNVFYLPFGYDSEVHRPWIGDKPSGCDSDLLFVGACDADRLPLVRGLADAGLKLALFGRYWDSHFGTSSFARGVADQKIIRMASASAAITLCLVRRANRDGHAMRSFEAAAIGGAILAEDTSDHRELFGSTEDAVQYFSTTGELVERAKYLLANASLRSEMSLRLAQRMARRADTYADRLSEMLRCMNTKTPGFVREGM